MRETRLSGSEGGGAHALPTPIIQMSNLQSAADAVRIPYVHHPGTGLERPAYSQAPRRRAEAGVFAKKL